MADDVGHDPHRRFGRINIGVADHELLQDVVLDGAIQLGLRNAGFLGGDDEEGEAGDDGAVHRHRNRHLIERDAVEQDLHVLHAVDGDAGLTNIARHARVIRIIAAMRRQIEGDRKPLLSGRQVAAIEGAGFLGRRETSVLPDGPRPAGIHGGAHAARVRRKARQAWVPAFGVLLRVERLDGEAFRGVPVQRLPLHFLGGQCGPIVHGWLGHVTLRLAIRLSKAQRGWQAGGTAMWSQGADREPIRCCGVDFFMAIEPTTQADPPEIISTVKARGWRHRQQGALCAGDFAAAGGGRYGGSLSRRARRPDGRSHQRTREELSHSAASASISTLGLAVAAMANRRFSMAFRRTGLSILAPVRSVT